MKNKLLILFALIFLCAFAYAQERTITGKVTSGEDDSSLPGVSVVVKGTTTGTITNIDGDYTITLTTGADTLVFSFIGFESQEVVVASQSLINVTLQPKSTDLQEVVVTALGIEREARTLGYSISTIESEELTVARDANVINSLQGKVSGIQIASQSGNLGGSTKILIRGISSLSGSNQPLWVIDGVQLYNNNTITGDRISGGYDVGNRAQDLNPDDIASISILKGASASALYGNRGANGVILVTTKKGKATEKGKLSVQINSSVRTDSPIRLPSFQNEYGPGNVGKYDVLNGSAGWGPRINGQMVEDFTETVVPLEAYPNNTKEFYRQGLTLINNLSLGGASDKSDFRLSLTSLNQTGVLPAAELDRVNVNLNAGRKFSNNVSARFGLQAIRTTSSGRAAAGANDPNVLTNIINFWPRTTDISKLDPWIDEVTGEQINPLDNFTNNPYWIAYENQFTTEVDRIIGNIELDYNPLDWINARGRFSIDQLTDDRFRSNRVGTVGRETGDATMDIIQQQQITVDALLTVSRDIIDDLNVTGVFGYQLNQRRFERFTNNGSQLTITELFSTGNFAVNNPVNDFSLRRLYATFYDITFSYKDWLFLNTTGRNDWTSTLPTNNNSYFYPSVNLSFIFTDAFGISNDILSYGKVRGSWANVGGDTGPYQLDFLYFPDPEVFGQFGTDVTFPFNGVLGFNGPTTLPPPALLPENQVTYEFGAEFQLFNGRLGIDVTYYQINQEDQILALSVSESTGYSFSRTNAGETSNKGIEIEVTGQILKSEDFQWNVLYTFTQNKFEVVSLADGIDRLVINSGFNSTQVVAEPGESYQLFGNLFNRDSATQQIIIDPLTGLRTQADPGPLGNIYPDFLMGLTNNFFWKGLNVRFTLDWREGGVIFSNTVGALRRAGLAEETTTNRQGTFIDNGVIDNGDGTFRPNDVPVQNVESFWGRYASSSIAEGNTFDASFIKLREIGISYTLPRSIIDKTPFGTIQFGFEARNVAILHSNVPHIDPETNLFGSANDGAGIERGSVPSSRTFGVNLKLGF